MSLNSTEAKPSAPPTPRSGRQVSFTLLVVAVLLTAAVAVGVTGVYFELRPSSSPSSFGTVMVTDDLGRNVTVPYDPSRVAVLGPNIMDSMYRLGLRSHVVGVDCYAASLGGITDDYSADQIALWNLSQSMCIQIGPTFSVESLLNATPQLVLAATIVSTASVEEISSSYGIPVVMLQPSSLGGIQVDLNILSKIFPVSSAAAALNDRLALELYNASQVVANAPSFPLVLVTYDADSNGYWTFGPGTFGESLIEAAGATSIGANSTFAYPELSPEQVLASNPQWIIYGVGFGLNLSYYAAAPLWSSLPAVQAGNITGLDSNWLTEADPTMVLEGLPALISIFHPGLT